MCVTISARCGLWLGGCAIVLAMSGCQVEARTEYVYARPGVEVLKIPHDAWLTWREYDGDDTSRVLYYFNGVCQGRGRDGFTSVLNRLRALPVGSRVLVFPAYPYSLDSIYDMYPYMGQYDELTKVTEPRRVVWIVSAYNQRGELVHEGDEAGSTPP